MATSPIARSVQVFVDKAVGPAAISKALATEARTRRDELIRSGEAAPVYLTLVDGVEGKSEDTAQRVISYRFSRLANAASYALGFAKGRSPYASGEYRDAWLVLINGRRWAGANEPIPPGSEVMLVNPVPYARKVDVGGMRMSVPPGIIEDTRRAVQDAYPFALTGILAERDFLLLPSGLDPRAPYTLKGQGIESGISYHKRRGFFQKHPPRLSRRKDRRAGQQITYPALILTEGRR
jgi:hypothetical protein